MADSPYPELKKTHTMARSGLPEVANPDGLMSARITAPATPVPYAPAVVTQFPANST